MESELLDDSFFTPNGLYLLLYGMYLKKNRFALFVTLLRRVFEFMVTVDISKRYKMWEFNVHLALKNFLLNRIESQKLRFLFHVLFY